MPYADPELNKACDRAYRRTERRRASWRSWWKKWWRARRLRVHRRDGWKCHYCRRRFTWKTGSLDHKVPRVKGGSNRDENIVSACRSCNQKKGTTPYDVFVERMRAERGLMPAWVEEDFEQEVSA